MALKDSLIAGLSPINQIDFNLCMLMTKPPYTQKLALEFHKVLCLDQLDSLYIYASLREYFQEMLHKLPLLYRLYPIVPISET